jgi:hypothetical protein
MMDNRTTSGWGFDRIHQGKIEHQVKFWLGKGHVAENAHAITTRQVHTTGTKPKTTARTFHGLGRIHAHLFHRLDDAVPLHIVLPPERLALFEHFRLEVNQRRRAGIIILKTLNCHLALIFLNTVQPICVANE